MNRPHALPLLFVLLCTLLALMPGCALPLESQVGPRAASVRVLTYNIHHGEGEDGKLDLARIAKVIADSKADLVVLQEVDDRAKRSGSVDHAAELGRLTGMEARFGKAMDFQGGGYGQAILSRLPIESFRVERLPGRADAEPRIAVIANFAGDKRLPPITLAGTHLDHQHEPTRVAQAQHLAQSLANEASLVILAGDFNARPGSLPMQAFADWTDATPAEALTYPAPKPTGKIDFVLLANTEGWRVVSAQVIDEPTASDHRPVLVELGQVRD